MKKYYIWMVAMLAVCFALAGCSTKTYKGVPDQVLGVWKTTAPKYADRFFELKKDTIVVGTGGDSFTVYSVTKTEVVQEKGELLYRIHYTSSEGGPGEWAFYYDADSSGVLRLKNQKQIQWRKSG